MHPFNFRQIAARTAPAILLLTLCAPARAADDAEVAELRRALMELQAQNRELARRLTTLEAEAAAEARRRQPTAQRGAPAAPAPRSAPATPEPQPVEARPTPPGAPAESRAQRDPSTERLERRVRELELARAAQETATRSIIRDAISSVGANINQFVALSGSLEVRAGRFRDFQGPVQEFIELNTAELDFDIKVNDWTRGSLIVSYDPGTSVLFPTVDGFTAGVDRINVDRATITIGDEQRFPLFFRAGRDVLPFGTSTGLARVDTLSISGPLTTDLFESRQDAIGIGFAFPTPPLAPLPPPVVIPPVRPLVINPLVSSIAGLLGYTPPPTRPPPLTPVPQPPVPPPFYGSFYVFNGNSELAPTRRVTQNINATLGYRDQGSCGRPYEELRGSYLCPWTFDFHVDYISSIFDSNFLRTEYRPFLGQIGTVPGIAASVKASAGPFSFTGEVNTALRGVNFVDDAGRIVRLTPAAWQASLAYQFDWNPWVEKIGEQGTFLALTYSGTSDMAGVTQLVSGVPTRVGFLPRTRLALTAGEWVLDNVKLAAEFSANWDYGRQDGGTGNIAAGFFTSLTLNF